MSLLQMSFSGAVMIGVIVVIRALALHKLPKKTFLVLWGVVLMRLLVPYAISSAFSVYSLAGRWTAPAAKDVQGIPVVPAADVRVPLPENTIPETAALVPDAGVPAFSLDPWMAIWLLGVLCCGIFFAAAYVKCRMEFRTSLPVDNAYEKRWIQTHQLRRPITIRQFDKISAPLTYGVFRPVILMPKTTDWTEEETLVYVLEHEYVHICRLDVVTKLALTSALCLHWFNPMVWMMYVFANRDMELSCDEAVIRRFGECTKYAYAMTLLRMEEIKSGLSPLCNNFSKNAIEERIVSIMKIKKNSLTVVLAAMMLVAGVTTAFATSGRMDNVQTVMDEYTIASYTDPVDGKTYYSRDGGNTWMVMTEKEFNDISGWNDVEWWTAEEYEAWLEQEKADLPTIIGSRGWTPSTGWFTWTQERVEETIAQYEQTLKDIQAGQKISKPTSDGDTIQFGYDPDAQLSFTDTQVSVGYADELTSVAEQEEMVGYKQQLTTGKLLEEYKIYGLTYEEEAFYYHGKLVRWFFDGYDMEDGTITIYDYVNEDGVVDIRAVREATQNADGSTDPGGKLAGIQEVSQEEFDSRVIMTPQTTQEATTLGFVSGTAGTTFEERFARYKDYGITYVEDKDVSGRGNVYLNGQLVSRFADVTPGGSAFTFTSVKQNGIAVRTVYDSDGILSGVEPVEG